MRASSGAACSFRAMPRSIRSRVIVAVDGRLESLVPELAGTVRTARLQMLATAPTREIDIPCPVYARYGFDYYQQLPDGSVALGGGRDKAFDEEWTTANEHAPLGGGRLVYAQWASRAGRIAARHVGNRRLLWNGQRGGRTLRAGRGAARQRRQQRIR